MGWAVVPDPFLARPSSSFSSSIVSFFFNSRTIFFLFLASNGVEGGDAAGCCARGRLVLQGQVWQVVVDES